jgi:hypothetical protein
MIVENEALQIQKDCFYAKRPDPVTATASAPKLNEATAIDAISILLIDPPI